MHPGCNNKKRARLNSQHTTFLALEEIKRYVPEVMKREEKIEKDISKSDALSQIMIAWSQGLITYEDVDKIFELGIKNATIVTFAHHKENIESD
ncbi:MAG: hypothetical protein ACTSUE_14145 [Promethearchaeota archaeon]